MTLDSPFARSIGKLAYGATQAIGDWLTPLFDLAIRIYVSWQFFQAGRVKIEDWESTKVLFQELYHVPVLPPEAAAALGTAGELVLPVLLTLGICGRFGAAGLFVVNAMAVISYPDLSDIGRADHYLWGALLLVSVFHGPGKLSMDHWLKRRYENPVQP